MTTIYVFNLAQVAQTDLVKAEALAGKIFEKTEIKPSSGPASWERHLDYALELQEQGHYNEADIEYRRAVQDAEHLGPDYPGIANILINVGRLRTLQHKYSEARAAFERSLGIVERRFGPDHFEVGLILGNIAMIHHQAVHYHMAEPLYKRAITILERTLGPQDARTAILKAGLAKLLVAQQRYTEAETLFEDSIPVLEKAQPPDDANLAITLVNLAEAYRADGRYGKAEPLYRRTLAMLEESPGLMTDEIKLGLGHFPGMLRKMKRKSEEHEIEIELIRLLPR